jgi:hypothetical protein
MAYRARARSIVGAVTRAEFWRCVGQDNIERFGANYGASHSASQEACWNTKINRRLRYVETAEMEDAKRVIVMLRLHGSARAAVIAGRYERAPTW